MKRDAARRSKEADRLRKLLRRIDAIEDAHIREAQALVGLDPNVPAVEAMRSRHLRAFAELETERDQIKQKLADLAKHTEEHGGHPALLDPQPANARQARPSHTRP